MVLRMIIQAIFNGTLRRVLGFPGFFRRHPPRVGLPGFPLNDTLQRVSGNFPICEKWMRKFTQPWRRMIFSSSTNPSEGYVSLNQPLRGVCVLQPTPPRGMCPSTNPSEGYVSFNQPLRGACVLQPTPPRGMCSPVGTPPSGSLQPTLPLRRAREKNKIRQYGRGHRRPTGVGMCARFGMPT